MPRGLMFVRSGGRFTILDEDGVFVPYFQGVTLGAYTSPQFAADDLADGHTRPTQRHRHFYPRHPS